MGYEKKKFEKSRSPLKVAPLRQAGQSVDEEIQRIWDDDLTPNFLIVSFVIVLALYEWWRWFSKSPPQPVIFTAFALVVLVYVSRKIMLAKRKIETLRLGRDGEKIVAEILDVLREKGYRVLHDIVGDNFNIDHLIIGPKGVFTVETKTVSKSSNGNPQVNYDGTEILVDGFKPDRDPVVQAKAQAHWIKNLVKELTGKIITVQPAVVYPGWYVNSPKSGNRPEVWVLNPEALVTYVDNFYGKLSDEDVRSFYSYLSRYVRNSGTR